MKKKKAAVEVVEAIEPQELLQNGHNNGSDSHSLKNGQIHKKPKEPSEPFIDSEAEPEAKTEAVEAVQNSNSSSLESKVEEAASQIDDLCLSDEVEYKVYENELQMPDIMRLIQKDLSEPYSIYTYRYFIHNWPHLCFMVRFNFREKMC